MAGPPICEKCQTVWTDDETGLVGCNCLAMAVMEHAKAHYNDGGWDVVVECYDLDEINESLAVHRRYVPVNTPEQAIEAFQVVVDVWADRQADAAYHREMGEID